MGCGVYRWCHVPTQVTGRRDAFPTPETGFRTLGSRKGDTTETGPKWDGSLAEMWWRHSGHDRQVWVPVPGGGSREGTLSTLCRVGGSFVPLSSSTIHGCPRVGRPSRVPPPVVPKWEGRGSWGRGSSSHRETPGVQVVSVQSSQNLRPGPRDPNPPPSPP